MCEFCHEHGEGKKWYLQMKNYSEELLRAELSLAEKKATNAKTRLEWANRFWQRFIMPAITGVPKPKNELTFASTNQEDTKIEHFGQVLPIEDVDRVIEQVQSITRLPCGCRFLTTGKTDLRYCFGLGIDKWGVLGKYPEATSSLEVLDQEVAKKILHQYDEEGLVHTIWTGVTPFVVGVCNCDRDCGAYRGYIEQEGEPNFFRAEYVGQIDWELCNGCKSCVSQCQFGAMLYSSALAKVFIKPTRCFGCGVCRTACPNNAIKLLGRQEVPEAANRW